MEDYKNLYSIERNYKTTAPFQFLIAQLDSIKQAYNELIKDSLLVIDEKQKKLDEELNKLSKQDDDEADIFYQHIYEDGRIRNLEMKGALLNSMLIFLYTKFENALFELVRICEYEFKYQKFVNYNDKCKKYRKGIRKAYKYIELSSKCSLQEFNSSWLEIDFLRQIRNVVVHRTGTLYKNDVSMRNYISSNDKIRLFEVKGAGDKIYDYQIIITKEYLESISKISIDYINQVAEKIWNNCFSKK